MTTRRITVTCVDIGLLVREHFANCEAGAGDDPRIDMTECCGGKWFLVASPDAVEVVHVPDTLQ